MSGARITRSFGTHEPGSVRVESGPSSEGGARSGRSMPRVSDGLGSGPHREEDAHDRRPGCESEESTEADVIEDASEDVTRDRRNDREHDRNRAQPARQRSTLKYRRTRAEQKAGSADRHRKEHLLVEDVERLKGRGVDVARDVAEGNREASKDRKPDHEHDPTTKAENPRDSASAVTAKRAAQGREEHEEEERAEAKDRRRRDLPGVVVDVEGHDLAGRCVLLGDAPGEPEGGDDEHDRRDPAQREQPAHEDLVASDTRARSYRAIPLSGFQGGSARSTDSADTSPAEPPIPSPPWLTRSTGSCRDTCAATTEDSGPSSAVGSEASSGQTERSRSTQHNPVRGRA